MWLDGGVVPPCSWCGCFRCELKVMIVAGDAKDDESEKKTQLMGMMEE